LHVIQLNVFFGVFIIRSVAKADHSGKRSRVLGWTMVEDRNVRPNRYSDAHNIMVNVLRELVDCFTLWTNF
jgi:hypothetical protein